MGVGKIAARHGGDYLSQATATNSIQRSKHMSKQGLPKSRLGRGLSSLMNVSAGAPSPAGGADVQEGGATSSSASTLPPGGTRVLALAISDISRTPHRPARMLQEAS